MKVGVVYLLTNPQLAARLVVSIYSLRKWYDGPVTVFTTRPESHEMGELLVQERRLRVEHAQCVEMQGQPNSTFLTKITTQEESPYDGTVYLDADTLIVGNVDRLIQAARERSLTVTAFCGWETTDAAVRNRLETWRTLANQPGDKFGLAELVDVAISVPQPVINAGVFAMQRSAAILPVWRDLAMYGRNLAIPDEMALQLLLPRCEHLMLGSQYNCSPVGAPDTPDVRIWHFFAVTHLRDDLCRSIWLPAYEECLSHNLAQMQSWSRVERKVYDGDDTAIAVT
jgi:hypothetical protein